MLLVSFTESFRKNIPTKKCWEEIWEDEVDSSTKKFERAYNKAYDILSHTDSDAYIRTYKREIKKLFKYSKSPQVDFLFIGVNQIYPTQEYNISPCSPESLFVNKESILLFHKPKPIVEFERVYFLTNFFTNVEATRNDGNFAWVNKEQIEDIIERCIKVLNNHEFANKLLPSISADDTLEQHYYDAVEKVYIKLIDVVSILNKGKKVFVRITW